MKIINLTPDNIDTEHLCCVLSGSKNENGVQAKKLWMKERFQEGLVFKKLDVKGKVFVEYLPAEKAWRPIEAPGYIFIHCLWVSGRYKNQGWGKKLLDECLHDAKNTNGVCVVASKQTYLTDPTFFQKHGFEICDSAPPHFNLMVKKNEKNAPDPVFKPNAKNLQLKNKKGVHIFYTDQCPFTFHYSKEMAEAAEKKGLKTVIKKINTVEEAQTVFSAFGTYAVFLNGGFLTHKIMSGGQFEKLLEKKLNEA